MSQPLWVFTLLRAHRYSGMFGRSVFAERQHVGIRPINHCVKLGFAYVRRGHLLANARGRAELKRRGFLL